MLCIDSEMAEKLSTTDIGSGKLFNWWTSYGHLVRIWQHVALLQSHIIFLRSHCNQWPHEEIMPSQISAMTAHGISWPALPCGCGACICNNYAIPQGYFTVALKFCSVNNAQVIYR